MTRASDPNGAEEARRSSFEDRLGHHFADRNLLEEALCHASFANEKQGVQSNDRLEFLGDAVVGLVTAQLLFEQHRLWDEGALTRALHRIVDRQGLASLARRLHLGQELRLGATEIQSGGQEKDSILADAMEAVLAALYLDGGLGAVRRLIEKECSEALQSGVSRDPKTAFQELVMSECGEFPTYALEFDSQQEGDEQRFRVGAFVQGVRVGVGVGRSKRSAEFLAAAEALQGGWAKAPTDSGEV